MDRTSDRFIENLKEFFGKQKIDINKYKKRAPKPNMATKVPSAFLKGLEKRKIPDDYVDKATLARKQKREIFDMYKDPQDYVIIADNQLFYLMGDGAGNSLWYSLKDGSIWFWDHEVKNKFKKEAKDWKEWLSLWDRGKL